MRILFFGDGQWATDSLRRLSQTGHDLAGLVLRTVPSDPSLAELGRELGLVTLQPRQVNAPEFVAKVQALAPELNLSVSYDQVLRAPILASAPRGFINLHAGMLPFYRGRNILNWALINGESEVGVTAHFVDEGLDTGDIIVQRGLPVLWEDTYREVLDKVVAALPEVMMEAVELVAGGAPPRRIQSHLMGSYCTQRLPGDEWVDWSDSSRNIYNKIRAITRPGPGARTQLGREAVTLWRAKYDPAWTRFLGIPGQVVGRLAGRGVVVKTGDSVVLLAEVQTAGEGTMIPTWPVGTRLGLDPWRRLRELEDRLTRLEAMVVDRAGAERDS